MTLAVSIKLIRGLAFAFDFGGMTLLSKMLAPLVFGKLPITY
jgi:hypothetical protein